jgi:hypothetical protein
MCHNVPSKAIQADMPFAFRELFYYMYHSPALEAANYVTGMPVTAEGGE